ncbi:hypothetical protein [Oryzomonas rubra]|uniref:Uncharacterized protein n=1 Tax=Oryzomonas rubra TaxID=2509454 RepID=A0A5A9X6J9_9BACT|nr:hypothetical protein [Oryzomonas rubra]KAA0888717.1 hypothetical protein ET418_15160 [Oryzomonas rubra]
MSSDKRQGLEVIQDENEMFTVVIRMGRHKTSIRGKQEYNRTLRSIIKQCECRLVDKRVKHA